MKYLALLRGINVGGKSLIKMADLKDVLANQGFENVATYIQSGNVIFESKEADKEKLAKKLHDAIKKAFKLDVDIIVFTGKEWCEVIAAAPDWWGKKDTWKHNLLVMTTKFNANKVLEEIGELRASIEKVEPGLGVFYQSLSWKDFGKARSGRIASLPVYKSMTIRNYNTSIKLSELLQ